jgi:hypothetical protein
VSHEAGVIVHGARMLSASNSQAAAYGPPTTYEIRTWQRGNVHASVYVGPDGRVAGHSSWNGERDRRKSLAARLASLVPDP